MAEKYWEIILIPPPQNSFAKWNYLIPAPEFPIPLTRAAEFKVI